MKSTRFLFDRKRHDALRRRLLRAPLRRYCRATEESMRRTEPVATSAIRRILVCRPNHRLGNQVMLTPLIAELERAFPVATIDIIVAGDMGRDLFQSFRQVVNVYRLPRRMVRHPVATLRTILRIRRAHYDLAIDPCEASQSGRLLLSVSCASRVIGIPAKSPNGDSNEPVLDGEAPLHMAQWPVFLLRNALRDATRSGTPYPLMTIGLNETECKQGREAIDLLVPTESDSDARILVGVFADATGAKRHEQAWWLRFFDELKAQHAEYTIVEIAPPDGHSRLSSRFPIFSSPNPRIVAAVISSMACFICADGGVMHLASASGTPTIGLFSVTTAASYAPYGGHNVSIETDGKTPEAVAQTAMSVIETVVESNRSIANAVRR